MREKAIIGLLAVIFSLSAPASALARMEFSLGGEGGRMRLLLEGNFYNQSLLRSKDFHWDRNLSLVSSRFVSQLELTLENLVTDLGPIDKIDFFTIVRPTYDGVYDFRSNWGEPKEFGGIFGHYENRVTPPTNFGGYRLAAIPGLKRARIIGASEEWNRTRSELKWERTASNDLYPVRELYFDITMGKHWLRLGKQQISWGKADNFRLQDIPNPVDFSVHSFYEPWEDIKIPQWYLNYQYQIGPQGPFENIALQTIVNFDDFEPLGLGQHGQPWSIAALAMEGRVSTAVAAYTRQLMNNPNLFNVFTGGLGCANPTRCSDPAFRRANPFGTVGVYRWHKPRTFANIHNMEFGGNLEFLIKGWRFAATLFYGRQDAPVDHATRVWSSARSPWTSGPDPVTGLPTAALVEIVNPKKVTMGLGVDYFEPYTATVWRLESSFTPNELWDNWNHLDFNSKHNVFRWVVGIDRPTVGGPIFQWINPTRSVFVSGQMFGQHIFNHEGGSRTGVIADRNQFTFTFALSTNYFHDRLNPSWFIAWSPNSRATTSGGGIEYLLTDHWSAKVGFHAIAGHPKRHYESIFSALIPRLPPGRQGSSLAGNAARGTLGDFARFNRADQTINGRVNPNRPTRVPYGDLQEISIGVAKEMFGTYDARQNDEVYFKFGYRF